ncbi:TetR family transcriptional regulator [Streptomyces sp. NPDC087420]|uniref:TetR family transcriptional regulator n=1 Tax=Streptomyces sp. NPDC087420 TaxID=3365785 RepID=UPI0038351C6B
MTSKSDATRARLLDAATEEFAAHGLAGARVDRIAAAASANKNLIYVYFGNKEALFDSVFSRAVDTYLAAVDFDPEDLPGYAGALFDFFMTRPHLMRLSRWHSLERPGEQRRLPLLAATARDKRAALAEAQRKGAVEPALAAPHLWEMVLSLAATWAPGSPDPLTKDTDPQEIAARRHALVVAVGLLSRPGAERRRSAGPEAS